MESLKSELIQIAKDEHTHIFPVNGFESLDECFTIHDQELLFWFNCQNKSTHIISRMLN